MDNRRKHERLELAIPVRVQGYQAGGTTWEEISTTIDVSLRGASFLLNHPLELGHVLRLTLALPKRLRHYDTTDSAYRVYTLVRFVERRSERSRIGVLFFGEYPPRGFHEHPDGRYLLPGDPMHKARVASKAPETDTPPQAATMERPVAAAAAVTQGDPSPLLRLHRPPPSPAPRRPSSCRQQVSNVDARRASTCS